MCVSGSLVRGIPGTGWDARKQKEYVRPSWEEAVGPCKARVRATLLVHAVQLRPLGRVVSVLRPHTRRGEAGQKPRPRTQGYPRTGNTLSGSLSTTMRQWTVLPAPQTVSIIMACRTPVTWWRQRLRAAYRTRTTACLGASRVTVRPHNKPIIRRWNRGHHRLVSCRGAPGG